ncbi:dienelactone hydrolase family protein [Myxacorys almedinensis]|uniref:Dienelactone hydrolase family protein n=1 Tax=Myxacorys almedinensis A TaxID=2690445 RepID=A0A8J7Z4Z4_9CYAN|nr:dienelactone hydrolase family protein [Myxacorys almedinensis]NDJ17936.1 dienelactone hydrolase family protein [Myxacorys almedinensis A]
MPTQQIQQTEVLIPTPDGQMPAVRFVPDSPDRQPAILLLMEAFGVTSHVRDVASRIAHEGYVVLVPDLYYRELPDNKFGYDEVEQAMAMMWRLDFGQPMENDLQAALTYLKSQPTVNPDRIGVTGFCLGGGLTFLTACKFSNEIAAAAPFYGMVLDEWIDAVKDITVPIMLFFGGRDPFISSDRIQQIDARFRELNKDYTLKIYPDAGHGFFCNERSGYNPSAAADAWKRLTQFLNYHFR